MMKKNPVIFLRKKVNDMSWEDILKMDWKQEGLIDKIMSDRKGRSVHEIIDAMFEPQHQDEFLGKVRIPTPSQVIRHLRHEDYRSEKERRRHHLALPDDTRTENTTIYYANWG